MKPKILAPKIKITEKATFISCANNNSYSNVEINQNPSALITIENTSFDSCQFYGIDFTENFVIDNINIYDCIFENCDLSNIEFNARGIHRCIFKNCKLMGTNFYTSSLSNIVFNEVNALYINFANCDLKNISITNSIFKGCNMMETTTKILLLDNVDFREAEIYKTDLTDVDFSNSNIDGITIDIASLKGIKVNSFQAMSLATLLGIKVV